MPALSEPRTPVHRGKQEAQLESRTRPLGTRMRAKATGHLRPRVKDGESDLSLGGLLRNVTKQVNSQVRNRE